MEMLKKWVLKLQISHQLMSKTYYFSLLHWTHPSQNTCRSQSEAANRTISSANSKEEVLSPPNWTQSSPWLHLELMWIRNRAGEEGPWPVGQCSVWVPPQNTEDTMITLYYTRTGLLVAMALESVFPLIMVNFSWPKIIAFLRCQNNTYVP